MAAHGDAWPESARIASTGLGDMDAGDFRASAHALADWIADYFESGSRYPVLAHVSPGTIRAALDRQAPERGAPMSEILSDFERVLLPGVTHWNQPGFMAYFPSTGSGPGVLGEFLAAALNQQAMLWRTSPAATELEEVVLDWVAQLIGLPPGFEGVIHDGGSSSNLHALAAARAAVLPDVRQRGVANRNLRVYASEQAHSSVAKAVILLGLGLDALEEIPVDRSFRMRADALRAAIARDVARGVRPMAVVATAGTTSTGSLDPLPAIAGICRETGVWLHVDAAYAGAAAILPDHRWILEGADRADSLVLNPHKWLFTPLDLSAFYCRRMDVLRAGLALTADYLVTREPAAVRNLMDTGISLGRRFRALKLWMVLRHFGAEGLRARISGQIRLARRFASWVAADPGFEIVAPPSLGVVCLRVAPPGVEDDQALDALNAAVLDRVNRSGEVFLSQTRLGGRLAIRLVVGQLRTGEAHVARAWALLRDAAQGLHRQAGLGT
uniref:Amino acid decarboxylase n=1 Tax=Eiseniibacteriota bacterium TaxID=2212470 RepID=A0A832I009_UNCEI